MAIGIIHGTTVAQLVYLEAIKAKVVIHLLITFNHIPQPPLIAWHLQVNVACPRIWQTMIVLLIIASVILQQSPLGLDPIIGSILPCTKAKVVEDGLHAIRMLLGNVILDILHTDPTFTDILIP